MKNEPTPEERKRMVDAAMKPLFDKKSPIVTPPKQDDYEIVLERVKLAAKKIHCLVQPIYAIDRDNGTPLKDVKTKLRITMHKFWLDELQQFNEDEVRFLCALVHTETMMDNIV